MHLLFYSKISNLSWVKSKCSIWINTKEIGFYNNSFNIGAYNNQDKNPLKNW